MYCNQHQSPYCAVIHTARSQRTLNTSKPGFLRINSMFVRIYRKLPNFKVEISFLRAFKPTLFSDTSDKTNIIKNIYNTYSQNKESTKNIAQWKYKTIECSLITSQCTTFWNVISHHNINNNICYIYKQSESLPTNKRNDTL